jgi:hypothetical protein
MAMRAIRSTKRDLFSGLSHSGTSSIKYRNWREPSNDGWRIQSVLERSAADYEKSVSDSTFLHIEVNFARLEEELQRLTTLHASIAEEGEERPSDASIEASLLLLKELRIARVAVESVVPAADGGVAIVLAPSGDARAYLQVLNDGERSLVMYNVAGDVYVEDLSSSDYLDALKFHLKAKELASAY